jgi:hypothetical protein
MAAPAIGRLERVLTYGNLPGSAAPAGWARPEMARVAALPFYLTHGFQTLVKYARFGLYGLKTLRMRSRVQRDPASKTYRDLATTPVVDAEGEALEMFELNDASRAAVQKARRQAQMREAREAVAAGAAAG